MLNVGRDRVQVALDAAEQDPEVIDLMRDDDPGVLAAEAFPFRIEADEVDVVERQDGAAGLRRILEMIGIRDPLISTTSFTAAFDVMSVLPQRASQLWEDILIGEES